MIKTDDPPLAVASKSTDGGEEAMMVSKLRTKSDSRPVSATYAKYEIKGDTQRNASDVHLRHELQETAPFMTAKNYSHPNSGANTPYRPSSPANVKFTDELDDASFGNGGEMATLESILKSSSILTQLQNQNVRNHNHPDPVHSLPTGTSKMQLMKNLQQLRTYKMGTAPDKKAELFQKVMEHDGNVDIAFKKKVLPSQDPSSPSNKSIKVVSKPVPTIKDPQEKNMTRPRTSGSKPYKTLSSHHHHDEVKEIVIRRPMTSGGLTNIPHIIGQDLNLDSVSNASHGPLYSPATFRRPATGPNGAKALELPLHMLNLGEGAISTDQSKEDSYRDDRREQFLQESMFLANEDDDQSRYSASRSPGRLIKKKYQKYAEALTRPSIAPNTLAASSSMPALTEKDIHVATHSSLGFRRPNTPTTKHTDLNCNECLHKDATLWCTQCRRGFCSVCWNRIPHHTVYNMIPTPNSAHEMISLTKRMHKQQDKVMNGRDQRDRSSSPHKSYSGNVMFTKYHGDDEPAEEIMYPNGVPIDRNLYKAPVPQHEDPAQSYVDYPNPPVYLDSTGKVKIVKEGDRTEYNRSRANLFIDTGKGFPSLGGNGKLKGPGPLARPFTSPNNSSAFAKIIQQQHETLQGPGNTNLMQVAMHSRSPSPPNSPPRSPPPRSPDRDQSMSPSPNSRSQPNTQSSASAPTSPTHRNNSNTNTSNTVPMDDSVCSEFNPAVTTTFHYVSKDQVSYKPRPGGKMKMHKIPEGKQIMIRKRPYKGDKKMQQRMAAKPSFSLNSGGLDISYGTKPRKRMEELTGITLDLNSTIDWKSGSFQGMAPPHEQTSSANDKAKEVPQRELKIFAGVPVYTRKYSN